MYNSKDSISPYIPSELIEKIHEFAKEPNLFLVSKQTSNIPKRRIIIHKDIQTLSFFHLLLSENTDSCERNPVPTDF